MDATSDEQIKYRSTDNHERRAETNCIGISHERKYYEIQGPAGSVFVKRSITPSEYGVNSWTGAKIIPLMGMERLKNEAAVIKYIKRNTNIPVPTLRCAFEDNGRFYVITDIVSGVSMAKLSTEQKLIVMEEIKVHLQTMQGIKSSVMGGLLGDACLPYRLLEAVPYSKTISFKHAETPEFVFCHNDLSQHNILVDEDTLMITAIIDWEYAGFYPKEFEGAFYERPGPSVALDGEEDDVPYLLGMLEQWIQK